MIHDDHRRMFRTLRTAFGKGPSGPWSRITNSLPLPFCENPAVLKVGDDTIVYYHLANGDLGAFVTKDFINWQDITEFVSFPKGYCIGSILKVEAETVKGLNKLQSEVVGL